MSNNQQATGYLNPTPTSDEPAQSDHELPIRPSSSQQSQVSSVTSNQQQTKVPQALTLSGGGQEFSPQSVNQQERIKYIEVGAEQEVDPEVKEYLQRVGEDKLNQDRPIVIHGKPIIGPGTMLEQEKPIPLPTTKRTIQAGLQAKVSESIRWLSEWCLRVIKKFKGRVIYSNPSTDHR